MMSRGSVVARRMLATPVTSNPLQHLQGEAIENGKPRSGGKELYQNGNKNF